MTRIPDGTYLTIYQVLMKVSRGDGGTYRLSFPYNAKLVQEVKAMQAQQGVQKYTPENHNWQVADTARNRFNLSYIIGKNPFSRYRQDIKSPDVMTRQDINGVVHTLYQHQRDQYAVMKEKKEVIIAYEMGCGKTLPLLILLEELNLRTLYVAPQAVIKEIQAQVRFWKCNIPQLQLVTYESMRAGKYRGFPEFLVFDESVKLKTPTSKTTEAAMELANLVRETSPNPHIILLSGAPAPKSPLDWWSQAEVACPGFLIESNQWKLQERIAVTEPGPNYTKIVGWKDGKSCAVCGKNSHDFQMDHPFTPTPDELGKLYRRLGGLVHIKFKRDCIDLPPKIYKTIKLAPSAETLRLASLVESTSTRAVQRLTNLRELSDGFQYRHEVDESKEVPCPECSGTGKIAAYANDQDEYSPVQTERYHRCTELSCSVCDGTGYTLAVTRNIVEVPCPKYDALQELMEERSRIVVFAGFTASVDRLYRFFQEQEWDVVQRDGRGWKTSFKSDNPLIDFQERKANVAFVGHAGSAGMGLNLTAADLITFFSNSFNANDRIQAEDRIHRPGQKAQHALIVDLIHLSTDEFVLENLKRKRDLLSITLGDIPTVRGDEE